MTNEKQPKQQSNPYHAGPRTYKDKRILPTGGGNVRYSDIPAEEVTAFLDRVCTAGGCAILGRTSDGGAYSLTVIVGDIRFREWPKSADEWIRTANILSDDLS